MPKVVQNKKRIINKNIIQDVTAQSLRRFDKGGDLFYEQISALHKSVRAVTPMRHCTGLLE